MLGAGADDQSVGNAGLNQRVLELRDLVQGDARIRAAKDGQHWSLELAHLRDRRRPLDEVLVWMGGPAVEPDHPGQSMPLGCLQEGSCAAEREPDREDGLGSASAVGAQESHGRGNVQCGRLGRRKW